MGLFEQFPYINFHDLNLDWILDFTNSARETMESYDERMQAVENAVKELYAADEQFRAEIARLDSSMEDINNSYQNLSESISALEQAVEELRTTDETVAGEIAELRTTDETLAGEIAELRTTDETLAGEIAELRTTDETFATEIENIKTQYRELLALVQAVRSVPTGGNAGQVLTADGAGGYAWADAPVTPGGSGFTTDAFSIAITGVGNITQEVE